ncbi:MAG: methylaspartate ammonia-lyase [Defluviitaleaceae bacterium]|nr:methylaspartate ammonia-lyase [Defluviitaleaceae bacterium]
MKILDVIWSTGRSGFFFDDQKAIKTTGKSDGNHYIGEPVTEGFRSIRQPGESVSIMLVLEDGQIAYGDCCAVQYSGASGRDPLFLCKDYAPVIDKAIKPLLVGREITRFKDMAIELDNIVHEGKHIHTALRYGATQAVLDAVAKSRHKLMTQIIAEEYNTQISERMIPIFSQSGDDRHDNADKMILKSADVLPHALFNNLEKTGRKGEKLLEYVLWLRNRIYQVRVDEYYKPIIHIDVYGMLGEIFGEDYNALVDYIGKLEEVALPFKVRIEGPVDVGSLAGQIDALRRIRQIEESKGIGVEIVADEWCNTLQDVKDFTDNKAGHMAQIKTPDLGGINNSIEAVIYCKKHGMGAYLGGTCNETDRSAQVCTHIAMATSPVQLLAKPGMGVDEGYMIVYNEMRRILAIKDLLDKAEFPATIPETDGNGIAATEEEEA